MCGKSVNSKQTICEFDLLVTAERFGCLLIGLPIVSRIIRSLVLRVASIEFWTYPPFPPFDPFLARY
jgi:hypothetical protein